MRNEYLSLLTGTITITIYGRRPGPAQYEASAGGMLR